jgi:hypothetical protein
MMKQKKKQQIPEPGGGCILESAVSPGYPEPHKHYATHPAASGLQPCLIEIPEGKSTKIIGALVVLPSNPPNSGPLDPGKYATHARHLSLIKHVLEREIENGKDRQDVQKASKARHMDWPFRSQRLNELIQSVETFLRAAKNSLPKPLKAAATELESIKHRSDRWTPWCYLRYEVTAAREENWRIIARWPEWESLRMTSLARHDEHLKHFKKRCCSILQKEDLI